MIEHRCPYCQMNFGSAGELALHLELHGVFDFDDVPAPVYKLVYVNQQTEEQGTLSTGTDYSALDNYAAMLRLVRPIHERFEVVFEADDRNLHPLADLDASDFAQAGL